VPGEFTQIRLDVDGECALVTLHRPEKLNAFTAVMRDEMIAALGYVDAEDSIRATVITGAGRAFCAGADMSHADRAFTAAPVAADRPVDLIDGIPRDRGGQIALRIAASLKPVIAAINGPAVGVGASMTLPMDARLASTSARFGFVYTKRGLGPEAAASWFLPRLVGIAQALEWTLTADLFDADEALRGGLVQSLHEPDALVPAALALARRMASGTSPAATAATRRLLWAGLAMGDPMQAHRAESHVNHELKQGPDTAEGVSAFLEKRSPIFTSRMARDLPTYPLPWPGPATPS
jgi:enoyl-CoA hydratase/carnithine racemase